MKEKRSYVRIPDSLEISYRPTHQSKSSQFLVNNISRSGIRFFIHEFIPLNSTIKLKINIKKIPFSFEALATIVWIKKDPCSERYEAGAHFSQIPPKAVERLMDYIKTILKEL